MPSRRRRLWVRNSLLGRLLVMCVVIAACSIAATAWAASVSTSGSIQQQYRDDFTVGATVYDAVLGHAAAHSSWSESASFLADLERRTQRSILLTDEAGAVIYGGTSDGAGAVPVTVVNPLAVAPYPGSALGVQSTIDPRAVGPFRLTDDEARIVREGAQTTVACLERYQITADLTSLPSGRTVIDELRPVSETGPGSSDPRDEPQSALPDDGQGAPVIQDVDQVKRDPAIMFAWRICHLYAVSQYQPSEIAASARFVELVSPCLLRHNVKLAEETLFDVDTLIRDSRSSAPTGACYESALREMLGPYVAPPALLSITAQTAVTVGGGLSSEAQGRVALISSVILLLTTVVCVVVGHRIVSPLNAVGDAAARIGRGERSARVPIADRGQIGALAASFNHMASELDAADKRRKHLVSDVAHELRTPLGNIRGWLEAAKDGVAPLDDTLVSSLLDESVLLQRIVDDLQDLSLADAGKLTFHPEPLRAADVLGQVAAAHRAAAEQAGLTLTVICRKPVEFTADGARLRQALGNLVGNAIRYTPAGGQVILRAERAVPPDRRGEPGDLDVDSVDIEVADTGLGIPPEQLPHVFDRFWRTEHSRSRLSGGSGLGLSIARHMIEAQGGQINVHSHPQGGGTVFTIRMPVRE